jgi:hypothetical protein
MDWGRLRRKDRYAHYLLHLLLPLTVLLVTEVNKAAMSYYQRAQEKKDATNVDGPDLQRIKDKVVKHKEEAQVTFKKGLSSMWLVGSNPPELGPGFYNPEDHHAMRPFQPKKESSCFNSRQVTTDNKFMGGNHDSMRPRFCKTSTHVSEDAQPKRQKLPLWKSFNSIPDEQDGTCGVSLLNKSSFQTSDTTGPTSEDAAVLSFPNSYPNKPRSLELSIQSGVRFTKKRAPWETRLRPHMGGSGSCHNLGTSINRDRDKRDWDSKGFSFGKSKAR